MKQLLLSIYKEQAVDARIKGNYENFLKSELHQYCLKKINLREVGE